MRYCPASFTTLSGSGLFISAFIMVCTVAPADGGPPAPFTEEAVARGINYVPDQDVLHGDGLAFVDLDGDRHPDLVLLGAADGVVGVYENDGKGYFVDHSLTSGIGELMGFSGVCAGDYDRDGDLDLYITRRQLPNALLRNEGNFQFSNVAATAGVAEDGFLGTGCAWGDYDNDGWLDLFVTNRGAQANDITPNRLYHNLGEGAFEEVSQRMGVDLTADDSFQASFFDFDRDGDADLFVSAIRGFCEFSSSLSQSRLFENVGGSFVDITDSSGTAACGVDSMCVGLGDFDGNGYQDIYITNVPAVPGDTDPGNVLLMNQGDGTFTSEQAEAGVATFATGWGSVFFDYDNDGHLDLYVCNSFPSALNRLYRHEGAWPAEDLAVPLEVADVGHSYSVAAADIDDDGDVDLVVWSKNDPIRLFVNHEGEKRRWAKFDVIGVGPSRYAIGANVNVRVAQVWRLREVIAGNNFKSQDDLVLHFGLGDAVMMDEIQVMWPGGATRTLSNYPTDRTWTLYPTDKLGDVDQDGDRDLDDFAAMVGCWSGPAVGSLTPGCEALDFDGDCDADLADFAALQVACSCGGS